MISRNLPVADNLIDQDVSGPIGTRPQYLEFTGEANECDVDWCQLIVHTILLVCVINLS